MFSRLNNYRDLFLIFIWRELIIRYNQTIIGVLWAVIQPISMMLLFVVVFGLVLNIETNGSPRSIFYLSSLIPWTLFLASVNASINSLPEHRDLITKIYFPRELIIFSRISVFVSDFLISVLLLTGMLFWYEIPFTLNSLWSIPLFILLLFFTASICLLFATINVFYRDVKLVSSFVLQAWFFATPIFYSVDAVSMKMKLILFLNPLTYIIENFRRVLIEERGVVLWQFSIETCFVILFFIISYKFFIRCERSFADVI